MLQPWDVGLKRMVGYMAADRAISFGHEDACLFSTDMLSEVGGVMCLTWVRGVRGVSSPVDGAESRMYPSSAYKLHPWPETRVALACVPFSLGFRV